MHNSKIAFLALSFIVCSFGWTKTFRSKFVTMELPPNWDCQQEELDWVCQPENPNLRNEAMVVIVTKATNPTDDSLPKYEEYLKNPKQMRDLVGNAYTSEIKYVKQKKIRDLMWVDSLQIGSEVPGFVSRYVASIKEQIAGLISYHVGESVFPKWAETLDKMIETAELRFDPKAFEEIMKSRNMSVFGNVGGVQRRTPTATQEAPKKAEDNSDTLTKAIGATAILAAIIGYIIYRRKKSMG
jgi:hypothetical protein